MFDIDADTGLAGDQVFTFIGTDEFTGLGQVRVQNSDGGVQLQFNITGTLAADMSIQIIGGTAAEWSGADFFL